MVVSRAGVRLGRTSVSKDNGAAGGEVEYGLDCGCQLGIRLGGTIMVERRLVNISLLSDFSFRASGWGVEWDVHN